MAEKGKVLIVEDNEHSRELASEVLQDAGYELAQAASGEECLKILQTFDADIILLDRGLPGMSGDSLIGVIRDSPDLSSKKIIIISAKSGVIDKIAGLTIGADDYLSKPYDMDELIARVNTQFRSKKAEDAVSLAYADVEHQVTERTRELSQAIEELKNEVAVREKAEESLRLALEEVDSLRKRVEAENVYLQDEIKFEHNFEEIIGTSRALKKALHYITQVAPTDATVLVLGESGTGKELFARAIHDASGRRDRPLVKVNCAALPANMIESELFGHEKGAFTGAVARRVGRFELAAEGTIFLDEIGELPLDLQTKLLRVVQEGEFERVGSSQTKKVDTRIIAATNRDLENAVALGAFREDLFYRLSVFPILIPPLRERAGDVTLLAKHFAIKYAAKLGKRIDGIPSDLLSSLNSYGWPGNVRELANVIERAVILTQGTSLEITDSLSRGAAQTGELDGLTMIKDQERLLILKALEECDWVIGGKKGAASHLNLPPSTLRERMQKFGLRRPG